MPENEARGENAILADWLKWFGSKSLAAQTKLEEHECDRLVLAGERLEIAVKALRSIAPYVAHNGDKWPGDIAKQALKEVGECP